MRPALGRRRRSPRRARHARRAVPVAGARLRRRARRATSASIPDGSREDGGHRARAARPPRRSSRCGADDGSQHAEPRRGRRLHPSDAAGLSGARTRSASIPVALGAHWGEVQPFVLTSGDQFRAPPPPALTSAAVRGGVRRGEAPRRRRHRSRRPTRTRRPDRRRASTGPTTARRACARRRASTTRSRSQIADQHGSQRASSSRACSRSSTSRWPTPGIAIWESKYYYQLWRPVTGIREADAGTGPDRLRRRQPRHHRRPDLHAARRAGEQPDRPELHAAVPGLSVGPRRLRRRAVPDPAPRSTAPTTSRSRSSPTSSTASTHRTTTATRARCSRAASPRSRRPRRRTARAASTSASTGRSTRPPASRRAAASPTTCSTTRSRRGAPAGGRRPAGLRWRGGPAWRGPARRHPHAASFALRPWTTSRAAGRCCRAAPSAPVRHGDDAAPARVAPHPHRDEAERDREVDQAAMVAVFAVTSSRNPE